MASGVRHDAGPGTPATPPLQEEISSKRQTIVRSPPPPAQAIPARPSQASAEPQQAGGRAGPRRRAAPFSAEAAGVGPVARQSFLDAEGSNGVWSEAAASGRGPGWLGGRRLPREE
ncbi:hypothetical protein NDU88_004526 [Pleurodeles waltl]|uniref:Uncharacterized protein n=1 Tax=Pleurodeles waltl TaxID=8319 RepID=A0AAV7SJ15_PLEWA|nr:hypothetical protein NDU88_004526 [Pleurodeles waltl]